MTMHAGRTNDQGARVEQGRDGETWYCGRMLGTAAVPGSDGRCGPTNGGQCESCHRYQSGRGRGGGGGGGGVQPAELRAYHGTTELLTQDGGDLSKDGRGHPDAAAAILALALRCDDKKVAKEKQCYRRYIIAFEHVSPVCRLTLEDEMVLLNSRYGFSDDEDPIYKERRTMLLKVQASGRPRGGAAVLKSPDADGGGGDGETVAAALIAHRNGGAISQLFDDTYCKAKLVEAHAAFEARAPPPVPAAPFVNIASLKENVKEAFGGFSVGNVDMDVAAADEGSGSGAWGSGGSSSGWGKPTSSWSVELGWLVPDVPPVALGGTRGTTPGTRVTGFEIEIVELDAEVAKLDDDRIAALGGGDDAPAATERWTVKRDVATTSSSHLDAAKKGGQKGGYWPDAEQAELRRYELCALFDRFVAKESKAAAKDTAAADGVSTSDSDQPDSRTLSITSARAAIAKRLLDTGVDKEKRDISEAEFAQWCAAARVEAFSTSSIDATVALAPRRITFSDFVALCTDGVAWATGFIGGAPGQVPPLQRVTVEFLRSDHAYVFRVRALSRVGKSEVASAASCVVRVPASPDGHDHPKEQVASRKDETNHAAQSLYEVPCRELQYLRPDRPFALRRDTDVAKEPQMVRPDRVLATMQGLFAACGVGVPSTDKLNDQKFVGNPRDGSGAWGSGAFAGARAQAMGFGLAFDIATGGVRLGLAKAIAEASLKSGECYDDRGDARIGRTSTKPGAKVESRTKDSESYAPSTVVIDHGDGMLTVRFVGKNRPTKRPTIVGEWMVRAREASKDDEPDDASAKRVKPVTLTQLVEGSAADERWRVRARRVAKKNKEKEKEKEKEKPAFVLAINADEKSVLVKFVDEFEVDQGKEKDEERGVVSKRVRKLGGWGRKTKKEVHRVGDGVEVLALEDYDDENEEEEDEAAGDDIAADSHINPDQRQLARGSVSIDGGTGKFLNYNSKRAMPVWKPASVAAVHPKDTADVDTTDPDQVTYDVEFGDRVWVKPELIYLDEDGSDVVKSVSTLVCAKKKADAPADDASPTDGAPEDDEAKTKASAPTLERDELLLVRLKIAMAASEMLNLDALVHAAAGVTLKSSDNDAIRGAWPADITQLAWLALVAKASARSLCASDACTIVAARDAFFGGACQDDDSDYAVAHDTHACNDAKRILGGMPALPYARGLVNAFVAVTQKPTYGDFSGGGFGRGGSGGGSLKLPYKLNESYKGQTGVSVTKEYPDGSVDLNIPGTPGESKVPRANVPGLPPFGAGGDGGDGAAGFEDTAVTAVGCDSFKVDLSRPLGADPTDAAAPSAIALHFGMGGYEFARALTARLVEFTELAGGSRSALPWDARNRAAFVTAAVDRANAAAIALPLPVPFTGGFAGGRLPPSVLFCESAAPVVPRTVEVSDDLRATVHVDATTKHLGVDGMALCAFANQPLAVAGVPPVGPTRTRVGAFIDVRPPEQSASERAVIEEVSTDRTTAVVRFADGTRRDDLDTKVLRLAPCALARVRLREDGGQPPREACVVAIDVDTGMCTVRFDEKTEHDAHMPLDDIVVCLDNDQRLPGGAAFEPGDIVDVPRATADPATSRLWVRGVVTDFVDDRKSDDDAGSAGGGGGDGIVPRYVRVMLACNRACIIDPVTATREPLSGEQRADINVLGGRARALADALLKHPLAALTTKAAAAGGDKELRESLDLLGKIAKDIGTSASDYVSQLRTDVFPPEDPKANDQSIIARGAEVDEAACKSCANLVSTCTRSGPDARALWLALEKHGGGAEEGEEDLLTMCTEMAANACDELDAFSASERAVLRDEIDATLAEANRSTALDDATRPDDEGTRKLALLLAAFEASAGNGSAVRLDDLITAFVRTETVAQLQSASRVAPPPCADVLRLRAPALDHATTVVLLRCVRLAQIGRAAQQAKVAEQDARDARTLLLRIVLTAESAQEVTEELIAHAAARRGISLHGAAAVVEAGVKLQKEVTKLACAHLGDDILKTPGPLSSPRGQHKSGHTAAARAHAKVANLACALTAWSPAGARHALHAHTPAAWRDALDAQRHKRLWCGQVLPKLGAMTAISVADARVNLLARLNTAQRAVKEFADILQTPRAVFKVHGERPTQPTSTFEQLTTTQRKWTFDPRVLVFELLTTFMVRQKQLELVENFLKTVKSGRSRVVQMIMGGGKTSVVSPLLGLMLADGKRLVSLIVPDSLLPQSKAEIQDKFVQILTKNVSEFRFVRTQGSHKEKLTMEDGYVEWAKRLRNARATRSIVCAGPSSMKALMLELVDVMQRLESVLAACADAAPPLPAAAVNEDAELEQYRARISKREAADAAKGIVVNKEDVTRQGGDERISCRDLEEEADALRNIIGLFGENGGVALIDEVDLILHPLKSELNFPIGEHCEAELSPERWELPLFILEAIFFAQSGELALGDGPKLLRDGSGSRHALDRVVSELQRGARMLAIKERPHLVLLHRDFYEEHVKQHLAKWALHFFLPWRIDEIGATRPDERKYKARAQAWKDLMRLAHGTEDATPARVGSDGAKKQDRLEQSILEYVINRKHNEPKPVHELKLDGEEVSPTTAKLINLTRQWLTSLVPHVLSKRNRIDYGLLPRDAWVSRATGKALSRAKTMGRKLLSIPFVGKDTPSEAAEFSSPDVIIGFTILSYAYEGLRAIDVEALLNGPRKVAELGAGFELDEADRTSGGNSKPGDVVTRYKGLIEQFKVQSGPTAERAAYCTYNEWVALGRKLHEMRLVDALDADDDNDGGAAAGAAGVGKPFAQPVPLDLLDMSLPSQADSVQVALCSVKPAIWYYLLEYVFPRCLKYHRTKLQASGLDLGSDCLFSTRLGFSGTPSNLLAPSLVPCRFQPGTQSTVLKVLMNPSILRLKRQKGAWVPQDLLKKVATGDYNALIDTGALITGFDNMEVAQFMLRHDTGDKFDAAVFLDKANNQVYITKSDHHQPKPIKLCGVPLTRRFTFYDQVEVTWHIRIGGRLHHSDLTVAAPRRVFFTIQAHTTGTDIKQHPAAAALATVGKGVTYRDHCQAVWRMRGIEKGQRVDVIIVDEVHKLIGKDLKDRHNVSGEIGEDMSTVLLWLIINHLESECMQHAQLAVQASMNTWRRTAFAALLNTRVVPVDDDDGDKQFKDAEALENAVYASRRVDPPDEPWEWAPESRLDLAAKERETSVRKATFVASFKLDPKEKRAKKQKKGGRVGATFEFLFKPPGGPADDEGITIILHGRQPNAEVSATHPSERPIPDMSLGGFDAESKLMTLHGGPPEPIPVPERSIAALVAYLAGPTPGSSSGKEESVKVDAKPRSPFTLSSQDSAEVLTEPGPPEKWHTKALVEDYAAPPGALPKEGGDEFGCLLLESVRALTHEKQLDARRIVTLADRSGKRVAASTTVRREAIIKELSDLDGIWIMTTPGCTADGAQADRATVHVAGGVAVSFAGFEQNKGVATLKFDTAEMLDKDAKVILLDDGGDTAWRLDGARSRDGCVVWVRAPNALKVFAIGGDSAAASSPLSTDKQAVKDHPKLTVWTLCASTYARVGELISFARPPTDDVDGNGTVRSFRLAKQFRVLDGLDDREIFKTAKYPPKDGSGKNLRGGEVLRYISRTPVALDEKNDGDYEIGENNSSKVQMFFYELADGRGFVHDHLPAAPEVRALELVSDGDRWLVDESESVIAEESAEATVPPIIVREVSSLSTLVVTANAGEHFRAHEARFRVHEGDTVRLHTPFAQEWRRAHVVSVARAPRTRARAASMSGGGVEMAFAAPGFSSYKVKYDDAPGGSDPPQWEKLDDLREVVRLAGECDDGVGAHLLPDEYSDATLFQPGDRVEFRERGNSATWLDMESSLVDAADSTEGTVVGGVWMSPLAVNGDEKEGRAPLRLAPGTAVRATIGARDNVVCRVQAANAEGCSYALAETVTTVHADVPAAAVTAFAVRVNDDADDDRSACTYARAIEPSALAEAAAPTTAETLELTCELSLALGLVVDLDCVILRVLADSQFRAVVVDNPDAPSPPPPPPRASMAGTEAALVGGSRWRIASIDDKPVDSRAALMHALAFRQRAALASVAPSASAMSAPAVCKLGLARVRARLLHYDEVGYSGDVPRMGVYSNH